MTEEISIKKCCDKCNKESQLFVCGFSTPYINMAKFNLCENCMKRVEGHVYNIIVNNSKIEE